MLMPTVSRYMTRQPWTIPLTSSIADAAELMRRHAIRHLPVVDDGRLVGLVSDRDLRLHTSVGGARSELVRDAMSEPVFQVAATQEIADVARVMSTRKYGSAVVISSTGAVEGIFTAIDACSALVEVLDRATG